MLGQRRWAMGVLVNFKNYTSRGFEALDHIWEDFLTIFLDQIEIGALAFYISCENYTEDYAFPGRKTHLR